MKRLLQLITALAAILSMMWPCYGEENNQTTEDPHVLFLSSYSYKWESNPLQLQGAKDTLGEHAVIDYEFMDTKRIAYDDAKVRVHDDIVSMEEEDEFDYVIAVDDAALHFAVEYQDELFADTPIIFEGINDVDFANEAAKDPLITGYIEVFPLKETIELAKKLNPNATTVTAITDDTISGQGSTKQFMNVKDDFPDLTFTTINCSNLTKQEIADTLGSVGDDTILVLLMLTSDADGNIYTQYESVEYITSNANVPVYKADELGMNKGLLGGVMVSYSGMAVEASNIVLALSNGADISEFPVKDTASFCQFDENVMKKFKISDADVTAAYSGEIKFINQEQTYFEQHASVLIPAFIIILLLIIMLIIYVTYAKRNTKMMQKMIDRDRMLDNLLNNMPGGLVIYKFHIHKNVRPKMTYYSQGIPKLSGRTKEEFDEWALPDIFINLADEKENEKIKEDIFKAVKEKQPVSFSYHRKDKNGKMMLISISASWGYDDANDHRVYYAVFMDETIQDQMKAAEKEMFQAKASDNAKSEFLSNMSHDIRTPISTIMGITNLAESEVNDPQAMKKNLSDIHNSSEYLLGIINDILDMSRIESGKYALNYEWINVYSIANSCINMMNPEMEKKKINFIYPDLSENSRIEYYVDVLKTQRMLINILNNACKFTGEGGTVSLKFKNLAHDANTATDAIIIEDTGCGMSEEFLDKIFTPFAQEHNQYSDAQPGTGLGLSLARQTARAMGGDITVESELGVGTKFTITFPYTYRYVSDVPASSPVTEIFDEKDLEGKHILLCEDSEINATIAKKQLESKKCIVDIAANGKIGLETFLASKENYYDAILMDIRMPEMDGLEAAKKIRTADRCDALSVPIIAMSANAYREDIEKSLKAGMNAHLAKPVDPSLLYTTIAGKIQSRRKADTHE